MSCILFSKKKTGHNRAVRSFVRSGLRSELVLFNLGANAARRRTRHFHHVGIGVALAVFGPRLARGKRVYTHRGTGAAHFRTEWNDGSRVVIALSLAPDVALRPVVVFAKHVATDAARAWACHEHHAWVFVALTFVRPARTVIVQVDAGTCAQAARQWTVGAHEFGRGVALAISRPRRTRVVAVDTPSHAEPTTRWTRLEHEDRIIGALALFGPICTRRIGVTAAMVADTTRVRTVCGHVNFVCDAVVRLGP